VPLTSPSPPDLKLLRKERRHLFHGIGLRSDIAVNALPLAAGIVEIVGGAGVEFYDDENVLQKRPISKRINISLAPDDDPTLIERVAS
jgi:hypothetical protein